ncbi:hypothetical protein IGI04_035684 [Brassica rapa subsp. trilocularis]|uniref:Uncharacterized protein n=1 Tax=Brassica rapa subsp. trilocularis TaxID=1813537 RepID=A0ABQ7LC87_BRACM|nr:hypothetical protein IGI04_035684 [Brassica rapa subsp. trilocularis]
MSPLTLGMDCNPPSCKSPFIYQLVDMTLASQKFPLASQNYHPLEELKPGKRVQETKLSPAEVARTAVELKRKAAGLRRPQRLGGLHQA